MRQRPTPAFHFACPDCGKRLEFADDAGELVLCTAGAEPAAAPPRPAPHRSIAAVPFALPAGLKASAVQGLTDPLTVTWVAAGLAATVLVVAVVLQERSVAPTLQAGVADPPEEIVRPADARRADPIEVGNTQPSAAVTEPVEPQTVVTAVSEPRPPVVAYKPAVSPPIDPRESITARLSQRLLRFEQIVPVAFDVVRMQIEEIAAVPIRYDETIGTSRRFHDAEVSLRLADVTLGDVLSEAAKQAGLSYAVEPDGVRLFPAVDDPEAGNRSAAEQAAVP